MIYLDQIIKYVLWFVFFLFDKDLFQKNIHKYKFRNIYL
ncbi:hypothetical protein pb186bvf_004485 [Paramecium bursaria]